MNFYENNISNQYPSAKNVRPDLRFARMLYGCYVDELKAISQYIYNEIMFEDSMTELSGIFERLSETEMIHFKLLGETLQKLGVNPSIRTQIKTSNIDLMEDVGCRGPIEAEKCINAGIEDELKSAEEYTRLMTYTNDSAVKDILFRMSEDEKHHYNILKSYRF